jgi:hypothetical protein
MAIANEGQFTGLQRTRVDKSTLIEALTANAEKHHEVYEKAMDGYKTAVMTWFAEQLDRAKEDKPFQTYFGMPMPEDHTADYKAVIGMLEMSLDDEIVVSDREYRQYVLDEWGWKKEWVATMSNYTREVS